jgi:hypothetical protein
LGFSAGEASEAAAEKCGITMNDKSAANLIIAMMR